MRLIPAKVGKFKQGQVYVTVGRAGDFLSHTLSELNSHGEWIDADDGSALTETDLLDGWYLLGPSDEPGLVVPEPKRDEFWEKCFLISLTAYCGRSGDDQMRAKWAALQADACVAERNARS